jgi:hypothetical protein
MDAILTRRAILTRIGGAFVDIRLTERTRKTNSTRTREAVDGIDTA